MRLFLYEFITGGGFLADSADDAATNVMPPSLLAEGRAMISALAADALAIPGVEIRLLWDRRLPPPEIPAECLVVVADLQQAQRAYYELANWAEGTIVVAPESNGILAEYASGVERAGGRLLSASPELIALCTDKQRTAEHLQAAGVPVPRGVRIEARAELPVEFGLPAVLKPIDGCGSQGVRLLAAWPIDGNPLHIPARLESFCPGLAASVAVLCGSTDRSKTSRQILQPLPPCQQTLSDDGTFSYRGGSLPLPAELSERAQSLALRAVACLPQPLGYLGVDLVLGSPPDGSGDVVIEINPRLTTSYVGLRRASECNLLAAWLGIAQGKPASFKFCSAPIQFSANGQVTL